MVHHEMLSAFKTGGTLDPNAPSYVRRPADDLLYEQICAGEFCYVLTARQLGKSSLMARTAARLRANDALVAMLDISKFGTHVTVEQWYYTLIDNLANQLKQRLDLTSWWQERAALSPVQRFNDFVEYVLLPGAAGRIVIFIDEIDTTLRLPFSDDFFAAVRAFYNMRATDADFKRLSVVLLGVAAPADLIKDRTRTPFNIGRAIPLGDLSRADAGPLAAGLEQAFPGNGEALLNRVFFWTGGHPYLTQKVCAELVQQPQMAWSDAAIDRLVERLFFERNGAQDDNLLSVWRYLKDHGDLPQLLALYRRVYSGERVLDDDRSPQQNALKLAGLVRAEGKALALRNAIYKRVFDLRWVNEHRPRAGLSRAQVLAAIAAMLLLLVALLVGGFTWFGGRQAENERLAAVQNVAGNCEVAPEEARRLFFSQRSVEEQIDLFALQPGSGDAELIAVASCIAPAITAGTLSSTEQAALSNAICAALARRSQAEAAAAAATIGCAP